VRIFILRLNSIKKQKVKIISIKNISANKASLLIVNKGTTHTPIAVTEYEQTGDSSINWYEMKDKRLKIEVDYSHLKSVFVMNAPDNLNLIDYANTAIVKNSLLKLQHPITVQLIGLLREPNKRQLNILPALGWNNADKSMIGLVFYNSVLSGAKFEYCIAPMFGIGSKRPVGMFKLAYNIYPKWVQSIQFKLNGQSFSYHDYYNISKAKTLSNAYYTGSLQAEFQFKNQDANSFIRKTLAVRTVISYQAFESDFHKGTEVYQLYNTNDLKFTWKNVRKINPYNISVLLQQGKNFMTLSSNAKFYISFAKTKGYVLFSLYAGAFLYHQPNEIDLDKGYLPPNSSLTMSSQSAVNNFLSRTNEDFTYDQIYLDRSGSDKILSHQVFTGKEGGFRSMIGNGLGASDKWIMSLSISSKLPKHIPIKPFVTIGTGYLYNTKLGKETAKNFLGEAGFSLVALDNILEIHFPLLITNNIKDNQNFNFGIHKFYERITFTLDLNLFNPLGQLKNIFL
jgi:hypothetical protein